MGWYLRKSFGRGPFRINLSRSGIGYSFGVRGFRVTQSARGHRYVTIGAGGLYYRQPLGTSLRTSGYGQRAPATSPIQQNSPSTSFSPVSPVIPRQSPLLPHEVADLITKAQQQIHWGIPALAATIVAVTCIGFAIGLTQAVIAAPLVLVLSSILVQQDLRRRSICLDCSASSAQERMLAFRIHAPFRCLSTAQKLWALPPITCASPSPDVSSRIPAHITETAPPWVMFSIDTPIIVCDRWRACFLTSGLLLLIDGRATITPYEDIRVGGSELVVPEASPPSDASRAGTTWSHRTPTGQRDPATTPNPQLYLCRYGKISISTSTVSVNLIASDFTMAKLFVDESVRIIHEFRTLAATQNKSIP